MNKFTFKTTKPTGRYRSFESDYHEIKLKKMSEHRSTCGTISDDEGHRITLYVVKNEEDLLNPNNNPNCDWKPITFKKTSKTLQEAKDWLNENFDLITKKYNVKQIE